MYAEIIINSNAKALNKVFDYIIPDDLKQDVHIGSRVFVPFGRSKKLEDRICYKYKRKIGFCK